MVLADDQWISFKVESETYVHSVEKIKEIISYEHPASVPGSARCLGGCPRVVIVARGSSFDVYFLIILDE